MNHTVVFMTACYYSIYCDLIHNGDVAPKKKSTRVTLLKFEMEQGREYHNS
jgi:hypothetical protein